MCCRQKELQAVLRAQGAALRTQAEVLDQLADGLERTAEQAESKPEFDDCRDKGACAKSTTAVFCPRRGVPFLPSATAAQWTERHSSP